ncbi:MAG: hypothetical protein FWG33_04155 [Oscillospiraceae bacterium]|nr:hypothetical protein [Oscillospiraceae bacterium]
MNNSIIEDLFHGETLFNYWERSRARVHENEDYKNQLAKMLSGEEKEMFHTYTTEQSRIITETALENFKYGFKLAYRIIIESLTVNP